MRHDEVTLEDCSGITAASSPVAVLSISLRGGSWGELIPKTAPKLCLRENWMTGFKKNPREQTDLQTRNWGLGVGWGDKLFGFLHVPYIHSDRVKTELSCKNIKHQI